MDELIDLGARLGGVEYAQGPGGNVSLKQDDTLLVKASGRRLRDLGAPGAIAEVPLPLARRALAGDAAAEAAVFDRTPRPSLETYFHALGARVVAHTHALGALLVACSKSFQTDALRVPYERPGAGLARAVAHVLDARREGVLILRSHGLLVYADNVDDAVQRSEELDRACRSEFPNLPSFSAWIAALPAPTALPGGGFFSPLPTRDANATEIAPRYLCPDAVVYATVLRVTTLDDVEAQAEQVLATLQRPVVLVADDGRRVHCARTADELDQAREVALAHDWIEDALAPRGEANYLADDEPAKIVAMPSEQYRLELTRKSARC